jgi:hypothetical protein
MKLLLKGRTIIYIPPFILISLILISICAYGQREMSVASPDKSIVFNLKMTDTAPLYKYRIKPNRSYGILLFNSIFKKEENFRSI